MRSLSTLRKPAVAATVAALAVAGTAPVASAMPDYPTGSDQTQTRTYRSLDGAVPVTAGQDLRSPDARDAGRGAGPSTGTRQDLRAPDTRDVAVRYAPAFDPALATPATADSGWGFDWSSAAIGVAASSAVLLLLAGGLVARSRHHRHPRGTIVA